jgi:hypothetical protein
MRTYRLARFVAILLFLAALIYFVGGVALGAYLWNRGLGDGWGSGFTGWISIPIFITTFFGALTLLMAGAVLYFLALINANLTKARQGGVFAAPKPKTAPFVPPAPEAPTVIIAAPAIEPPAPPDLLAELPAGDADAEDTPPEFTGRLPGAEQAARIATELAAAKDADQPTA